MAKTAQEGVSAILASAGLKTPKVSKNKKQPTQAKKGNNQMKTTVITVAITLIVTAIVATAFIFTYKAGLNSERNRNSTIQAEAKNLITSVAPLK